MEQFIQKQRKFLKRTLNWNYPMQTRAGSEIRIYEVFDKRYVNGAYYESSEDIWYPCQWDSSGLYGDKPTSIDLVNVKEREVA